MQGMAACRDKARLCHTCTLLAAVCKEGCDSRYMRAHIHTQVASGLCTNKHALPACVLVVGRTCWGQHQGVVVPWGEAGHQVLGHTP